MRPPRPIPVHTPGRSTISARTMNVLSGEVSRMSRLKGDGGVEVVQTDAGPVMRTRSDRELPPIFAKITGAGSAAGLFDAVEQKWNDAAQEFQDKPNGLRWSDTEFPELREANGIASVPAGTIVRASLLTDDENEEERLFFDPSGQACPFQGEIDPADDTRIVIGRRRSDTDYEFVDAVIWDRAVYDKDFTPAVFFAPETVTITETSFVFYEFTQRITSNHVPSELEVVLKAQDVTTGRPRPFMDDILGSEAVDQTSIIKQRRRHILGRAEFSGGKVTRWTQYWKGGDISLEEGAHGVHYNDVTRNLSLLHHTRGSVTNDSVTLPVSADHLIFLVWQDQFAGSEDWTLEAFPVGTPPTIPPAGSLLGGATQVARIKTDSAGKLIILEDLTNRITLFAPAGLRLNNDIVVRDVDVNFTTETVTLTKSTREFRDGILAQDQGV